MVLLFTYINYNYLSLFKRTQFENLETEEEQRAVIQTNIEEYHSVNYLGTLFSSSLVLHLVQKAIFNLFAKVKMPIDKWTLIDIASAILNIICFNVIGSATTDQILN